MVHSALMLSPQDQRANHTAFTAEPRSLFVDSWVASCDFATANNAAMGSPGHFSVFPMGYAHIITPFPTRTLGILLCWVFPVSAEGSTLLYGTIPPDKNVLHGFSEHDR